MKRILGVTSNPVKKSPLCEKKRFLPEYLILNYGTQNINIMINENKKI